MGEIYKKIIKVLSIVLAVAGIGLKILCAIIKENGKGHQVFIKSGDKIISKGVMGGYSEQAMEFLDGLANLGLICIILGLIIFAIVMIKDYKDKKKKEGISKEKLIEQEAYAEVVMCNPVSTNTIQNRINQEIFFKLENGTMIRLMNQAQVVLNVGDKGMLIWSGEYIKFFAKEGE